MGNVRIFTQQESDMFWGMGNPKIMDMHKDRTILLDGRLVFKQLSSTNASRWLEILDWIQEQSDDIIVAYTSRRLMKDDDGDKYFQALKQSHPTIFFQHPETAAVFKLTFNDYLLDLYDSTLPVQQ